MSGGIGLALLLTLVPFALVHWGLMPRAALFIAIGAFALVQMAGPFPVLPAHQFSAQARGLVPDPVRGADCVHHGGRHHLDHVQSRAPDGDAMMIVDLPPTAVET